MNSKEKNDDYYEDNISSLNIKINNDKNKDKDKDNKSNDSLHINPLPNENYYSNYDSHNKNDLLSKEEELKNFLSFLEKKKK